MVNLQYKCFMSLNADYLEKLHRSGNKLILVHSIELPELSLHNASKSYYYVFNLKFVMHIISVQVCACVFLCMFSVISDGYI